jgi:hypothetical protein
VVPVTTTTVAVAVAVWARNGVQQGQEHLGEFPRRHLTNVLDLHFNLSVRTWIARRVVLIMYCARI